MVKSVIGKKSKVREVNEVAGSAGQSVGRCVGRLSFIRAIHPSFSCFTIWITYLSAINIAPSSTSFGKGLYYKVRQDR
uniref:Uncharacterized protein n=1 Tax=Utricularia reniformis TaxID=192314 RepID=A0A1Y0B473_9LAMI|nr:hypothetical protein AEK19_MT2029 [Utricularia reniformis]ART32188.1 hypothetical protein AEK19_MT2029 [Utricularia reniformis]